MNQNRCTAFIIFLILTVLSVVTSASDRTIVKSNLKKTAVKSSAGAPYKVSQKKIYPKKTYNKASYYLRSFHGRKTANGEFYNKNDFTCAHRFYRFNTLLRITNLMNNKSVIVRVNDRGPYSHKRVVDLSEAAAHSIDMVRRGVISVSVTLVRADSLFKPEKLEMFSADTTYSLYGSLTKLTSPNIYLWKTYNLGHLIALSTSMSDRLPPNELVIRRAKFAGFTKYELFLKCRPEEGERLVTEMKEFGFLRARL